MGTQSPSGDYVLSHHIYCDPIGSDPEIPGTHHHGTESVDPGMEPSPPSHLHQELRSRIQHVAEPAAAFAWDDFNLNSRHVRLPGLEVSNPKSLDQAEHESDHRRWNWKSHRSRFPALRGGLHRFQGLSGV